MTSFVEWVLGVSRSASAPFVITERDATTGAIFATNAWNTDFPDRVAFADLGGAVTHWTGDRTEFIGRDGTLEYPAALHADGSLSGRLGAGLDPCGAQQVTIELAPGESHVITLLLGQCAGREEASALIARHRTSDHDALLREVMEHWDDLLGAVQVTTPNQAMDLVLNRWLLYQTTACRLWARSAFYQASGAYGFRDQLQDVMALAVARPDLTRAHLLRSAARQFVEGDVQHWWHPTTGRGLRTRMSDDLLWLPYVVTHYVQATADSAVLDEHIPFLEGSRLGAGELECYFEPRVSDQQATLYEHCARALDASLSIGAHRLPLIGTGDWNDGMNRVGYQGRGESVWLGWFLCTVMRAWAPLAEARGEPERAAAWRAHIQLLTDALERDGWDGHWYRRAYFDDGTPLGSAENDECRIDAISQSWSVLSGVADRSRAQEAMAAVDEQLVRRDTRIHLLLTPPFDKTAVDPGYIKGYLPGIRENGGQYTHAATWSVIAWTALCDGDRATELFDMINPILHARTPAEVARYKVEPYVVAGDVYSVDPHGGRGGWTWYSGAAGWLYRAGLESILGFGLRGTRLMIDPCIPKTWPGFKITFRYHSARYEIQVENPRGISRGVASLEVDGAPLDRRAGIPLADDGRVHAARVIMGAAV